MRRTRGLLLALCVGGLSAAALVIGSHWVDSHRIVSGPQNQSALFKNYDPEGVIKDFRRPGQVFGGGRSMGASIESQSVRHTAGFDPFFTIEVRRKTELLAALNKEIFDLMQITGTPVVEKKVELNGESKYRYSTENGVGSISVRALKPSNVQRNSALPNGLEDISLEIDLEETWNVAEQSPATERWKTLLDYIVARIIPHRPQKLLKTCPLLAG